MKRQPLQYLIIDDDPTSNLICEMIIRKFNNNARVDLFPDPVKALDYIRDHYYKIENKTPTILFLDVNMPEMSGFEFLDEFKDFDPEIRDQFIIYMLSSSIEDFNSQAVRYPCVSGFLSKPLKVSHLQEIFETEIMKY